MRSVLGCIYMIFMCVFVVVVHTAEDMMFLRRANTQNHHLLENIRRKLITDNEEYDYSVKEIHEAPSISRKNLQDRLGADDEAFIKSLRNTKDVGQMIDKEHKKENVERIGTGYDTESMEKEAKFLEELKKGYNRGASGGQDFNTFLKNMDGKLFNKYTENAKRYYETERIINNHGLDTKFNKKEGKRRFKGSEKKSKEIENAKVLNSYVRSKELEAARLSDENMETLNKNNETVIISGRGFNSKELKESILPEGPQKTSEDIEKVRLSDFDQEKRRSNEEDVVIGGLAKQNLNTFFENTKTKYAYNNSDNDEPLKIIREKENPASNEIKQKTKGIDLQDDSNSASPVFVANFYPIKVDVKSKLLSRRVNAFTTTAVNETSEEAVTFRDDMSPLIRMKGLPYRH